MPRDKTATHERLFENMRREFLENGFDKASLNTIARKTGITPAAIYRHFKNKEAMFEALVKPVVEGFYDICNDYMEKTSEENVKIQIENDFSWAEGGILDYVYEHFDEFRLLVVCSKGTKYEGFFDALVKAEEESSVHMISMLKKIGQKCPEITPEQHHIVATMYMTGLYEIIKHNMPKEKAIECIKFIGRFHESGWRSLIKPE